MQLSYVFLSLFTASVLSAPLGVPGAVTEKLGGVFSKFKNFFVKAPGTSLTKHTLKLGGTAVAAGVGLAGADALFHHVSTPRGQQ